MILMRKKHRKIKSKFSHYVDDTQVIFDGSENFIKIIELLNNYYKIRGLKVNLNKPELIPLGHSKIEIYTFNFFAGIKRTKAEF